MRLHRLQQREGERLADVVKPPVPVEEWDLEDTGEMQAEDDDNDTRDPIQDRYF